jgi:hypothetical protein
VREKERKKNEKKETRIRTRRRRKIEKNDQNDVDLDKLLAMVVERRKRHVGKTNNKLHIKGKITSMPQQK